jgi:hypothetical protein
MVHLPALVIQDMIFGILYGWGCCMNECHVGFDCGQQGQTPVFSSVLFCAVVVGVVADITLKGSWSSLMIIGNAGRSEGEHHSMLCVLTKVVYVLVNVVILPA